MTIDFHNILQVLKQDVAELAEKDLKDYAIAATTDGCEMISKMQATLENWTTALATGSMSKSDFADLIAGQNDEFEMASLKQAGLSEIVADQFKQDISNLITSKLLAALS